MHSLSRRPAQASLGTGCQEGSPCVHVLIQPLLASPCGCSSGQGQPHGQAQNPRGEASRRAATRGGGLDHVRRAWCPGSPLVVLCPWRADPGRWEAPKGLFSPYSCRSQSPAHLPGTVMALCATEALSEGWGGDGAFTAPEQQPLPRAKRQQSSCVCSQCT